MSWSRPRSSPRWRRPRSTRRCWRRLPSCAPSPSTATEAAASGSPPPSTCPEGRRADSEDALAAVVRLIDAEHAADAAERAVTARSSAGGFDVATVALGSRARPRRRARHRPAGRLRPSAAASHHDRSVSVGRTRAMHIVRIGGESTEQHSADSDRRQGRQPRAHGGARSAGAAGLRAAGQALRRDRRPAMRDADACAAPTA